MTKRLVFPTDQYECFDAQGNVVPCNSEQDPTGSGLPWPSPRFHPEENVVLDRLTGLTWTLDAAESMFPITWNDAFDLVSRMNRIEAYGRNDWRLPNRRELFSLLSHVHTSPAMPSDHPFLNVSPNRYWTSTSLARLSIEAWQVDLGTGVMDTGKKHEMAMVWPVCGGNTGQVQLAWTGQKLCYSPAGIMTQCDRCGQDGELRIGAPWPSPRFTQSNQVVLDLLTGLSWAYNANCGPGAVNWEDAFQSVAQLNQSSLGGHSDWRVPTIRELESITDMGGHTPAISQGRPFVNLRDFYWSSSTTAHAQSSAWILETMDGKITVRRKKDAVCHVWAVRS